MRTLLTMLALLVAAAAVPAQPPPIKASGPIPVQVPIGPPMTAPGMTETTIPAEPPSDQMVGPVVAVICVVVILFAVCYPMRRDE